MFIGTLLCMLNNYKYKHNYLGCQPFLFVNICFFVLANFGTSGCRLEKACWAGVKGDDPLTC